MGRKRKKKRALSPRHKRMTRSARLQSAGSWLSNYDGNNVLRGYCRHYGVDWRCAVIELGRLGIKFDDEYLRRRAESEQQWVKARRTRKESKAAEVREDWPPCESAFETYLAGDYAALHALEHAAQDT